MIDSSLFIVDLPAGSYTAGDVIEVPIKAGPSVVRSGRGAALLKRLTTGIISNTSGALSYWKVELQNSDWVDPMINITAPLVSPTVLDERCGCVQRGNNCILTPNSSWTVKATCLATITTTVDNELFALVDIDYPSVSSIVDPDACVGIPASIDYISPSGGVVIHDAGAAATANWSDFNVDFFKAGYAYALQKVEVINAASNGFLAIANAAGMAGLQRIIPISSDPAAIRNKIEYASQLVKGPMDIRFMMFHASGTGGTATPEVIFDFVKRKL